jgi:hypothetical protein
MSVHIDVAGSIVRKILLKPAQQHPTIGSQYTRLKTNQTELLDTSHGNWASSRNMKPISGEKELFGNN